MPKKKAKAAARSFYKSKPPKQERGVHAASTSTAIGVVKNPGNTTPAALKRTKVRAPADLPHAHVLAPAHFTLRDDGTIQAAPHPDPLPVGEGTAITPLAKTKPPSIRRPAEDNSPSPGGEGRGEGERSTFPRLLFQSDTPFLRLYHGNSLELLDAIAAKYPEGRFDCIFADPPYFLSNGGITCHAGKMVKVDKGDWDKSRGPELNHEFNLEWLRRCQRVLKPNGTIWVSGTLHVIFSIGYALQQLGYKILNDITWEKPNPPPNLSCRYFTHSTETVIWAAKNEKSKHVFNYDLMRQTNGGKQMKTVWREVGSSRCDDRTAQRAVPTNDETSSIWTLTAPGNAEKEHGKHPTQKPVSLIERCLLAATNEGDLVLDPFLGGGTTAVAAVRIKRGCVGVEADLAYVSIATKRADRETVLLWLREFRVNVAVAIFLQNDLDPDGRSMDRISGVKDGEP